MSSENLSALMKGISLGQSQDSQRANHNKTKTPKPGKLLESKPRNGCRNDNRSNQPSKKANRHSLPPPNTPSKPSEARPGPPPTASPRPQNNPPANSTNKSSTQQPHSKLSKARRELPPNTPQGPKKRQPGSFPKKSPPSPRIQQPSQPSLLYIVQYQPYNPTPAHCDMLFGVFTHFAAATECVETCSAAAHSQPGLNGAMEYAIPSGKLKVLPKEFHQDERGAVGASHRGVDREDMGRVSGTATPVRSNTGSAARPEGGINRVVYLALDRTPSRIFCVGTFAEKSEAWEACRKYQSQLAYFHQVKEELLWVDECCMPHVRGRLMGVGSIIGLWACIRLMRWLGICREQDDVLVR